MQLLECVTDAVFGPTANCAVLSALVGSAGQLTEFTSIGYSEAERQKLIEHIGLMSAASIAASFQVGEQAGPIFFELEPPASCRDTADRHSCMPLWARGALVGWLVVRVPGGFDDQEIQCRLKAVSSLLARTIGGNSIGGKEKRATTGATSLLAGLAESAPISFLVDEAGLLVAATQAATESARTGPLILTGGRLRISAAALRGRLDKAIATVVEQARAGEDGIEVIRLESAEHSQPQVVVVRTLPRSFLQSPAGKKIDKCLYWVSLRTLQLMDAPTVAAIRAAWPLSAREAELVRALLRGETLEERAKARGVSTNAELYHLKNVFKKMGCSGKSEMVLLVVGLLGLSFQAGDGDGGSRLGIARCENDTV